MEWDKSTVVIHHIVSKGTVDEKVMKALQKKQTGQDTLINEVKARIGGGDFIYCAVCHLREIFNKLNNYIWSF